MSKKANRSIYHIENYIQMQKINCILKIWSWTNSMVQINQVSPYDRNKMGIRICYQVRIFILCSYTQKVRESMFKKNFKILLVSK